MRLIAVRRRPLRERVCIFVWIQKCTKKITAVKKRPDACLLSAEISQTRWRSNTRNFGRFASIGVRAAVSSRPTCFPSASSRQPAQGSTSGDQSQKVTENPMSVGLCSDVPHRARSRSSAATRKRPNGRSQGGVAPDERVIPFPAVRRDGRSPRMEADRFSSCGLDGNVRKTRKRGASARAPESPRTSPVGT